jgi:hypothetical protein
MVVVFEAWGISQEVVLRHFQRLRPNARSPAIVNPVLSVLEKSHREQLLQLRVIDAQGAEAKDHLGSQ